ncbi:glycosyltransferase [Bacillus lacus]|uniref:Glycosyltransferase n=1 Tax=Metabacillus lacus TaxID=1983721 RepID=A0A7X2IZB8_9BACI|nr:polysaccharide deacetylase family protein [Metabacillus lacus]MRX72461.1 glycosyltransferase [Metabacillus lacus]
MKNLKKSAETFVFYDKSGKRWKISKAAMLTVLSGIILLVGFISFGLVGQPSLKGLAVNESNIQAVTQPIAAATGNPTALFPADENGNEQLQSEVYAFYQGFYGEYENHSGLDSLESNLELIDVLIPDTYHIGGNGKLIEHHSERLKMITQEKDIKVVPSVSLSSQGTADTVSKLVGSSKTRQDFISKLQQSVLGNGYDGIHIHLPDIHTKDKKAFTAFVKELKTVFESTELMMTLHLPEKKKAFETQKLSEIADKVILLALDERNETDRPGPLTTLKQMDSIAKAADISPDKIVLVLGNHGYDWQEKGREKANTLSFQEIMLFAEKEGLAVQWDENSLTPYVRYKEGEENRVIWFQDAVTFYNSAKVAKANDINSIGLWNLGSEDQTIWQILKNHTQSSAEHGDILKIVAQSKSVHQAGAGDIFKVSGSALDGARSIVMEEGIVTEAAYNHLPSNYQIERFQGGEKEIALTFDDGPHPKYTNQILDILKEYEVKATFFTIGKHMSLHPGTVKRTFDEGHDIGNHTFTHANISKLNERELQLELNSTQRLIQGITGHSSMIFRPPFLAIHNEDETQDEIPEAPSIENVKTIKKVQEMGYTFIDSLIDPKDWDNQSAEDIYEKVMEGAKKGQIVLLHDAGGDRSETVKALPMIIESLQEEGYTLVPVSKMLNKSRDEIMPKVEEEEAVIAPFYKVGSGTISSFTSFWQIFFYSIITIGIIRLSVLVFFSFRQRKKERLMPLQSEYSPFVTVLIAAYNEETVISKTIRTILNSDYRNFEIIVVDDGSKDNTAAVVQQEFSGHSMIKLLKKPNGGKCSALNRGFAEAKGEIIVTLDADTILTKRAISLMVRHFTDPAVASVAGNVKIGNIKNLITLWQHVEYVTGFNLEKRAFHELNCIPVVPGAIGAWRKKAVQEVGLFSEDTLAEDTDTTIRLLRKGYKIPCEAGAIAYTEAPETAGAFIKQRYRWTYGILQCLWKHKGALFNRKQKGLGFFGFPNMIFQYVLQAASPAIDIILLIGILAKSPQVLGFYFAFLLIDTCISVYAFKLEGEKTKPLLLLFIQRMVYRQFFALVVWKSFVFAARGGMMGWNKLQRTGSVQEVPNEADIGA